MPNDGLMTLVNLNSETSITILSQEFGVQLGFNEASVQLLARFIERTRVEKFTASSFKTVTDTLGSFLGECIRYQYGGEWEWDSLEQKASLRFANGSAVFPFIAVANHFENGSSASVLSLYRSVPQLIGAG